MADAHNRMELRANLYNDMADQRAQRVADSWDQVPAESKTLSPQDVHAMWHFTPSQDPAADFWNIHDTLLAQALSQNPNPQPADVQVAHKQAELGAIQAVYPYRLIVAPVQDLEPEAAVQRAERAFQTASRFEQGGGGST